jgi:hypothetical protein
MKVAVRATDGTRVVHTLEGELDEVTVDPWLHVEQLDDDAWYLRVGDVRIGVTVEPNGSVGVDVERGFYAAVQGRTSGHGQGTVPSSAPQVNAGVGQTPEAGEGDPEKGGS